MENIKFDFNDILIKPAVFTEFDSRSEVSIYDDNKFLPLMTAPMDTVVSEKNYSYFKNNKIYSILPRIADMPQPSTDKFKWVSYNLDQFINYFIVSNSFDEFIKTYAITEKKPIYVLIDIANGHLLKMYNAVEKVINRYGKLIVLMVGNVANPETYKAYSEIGVSLQRVGIGNGGGCLTTENTAIGHPMASLIKECYDISCTLKTPSKIVADGGMKTYSDIIKSLALGADYVMAGGIFNRALESCADTYLENIKHETWTQPGEIIDQFSEEALSKFKNGTKLFKKFRGMSTKDVQKTLGNTKLKTSEGIVRMNPVEYTLAGWVENFKHYLSSAMSYSNSKTLSEFRQKVEYIFISQHAYNRFHK